MRHDSIPPENKKSEPLDTADLKERLYAVMRRLDKRSDGIPEAGDLPTATRVLSILRARRLRERLFDSDLFADPAWDMLLELYAAKLEDVRITVSKLAAAAAVPASTALRWMKLLEARAVIQRIPDRLDDRRTFIELTPTASNAMAALLAACPQGEPLI